MLRISLLLVASLTASACAEAALSDRDSARDLRRDFDSIIEAAAREGFAGQLVVMRSGAVVYERAAGSADIAGRIPVTVDTLYQVSSVSKFFTAALALKAVEDGELALDERAATLFAGTALESRDFTLEEILSHHSGLRSTYAAEHESEPSRALDAIAKANERNLKDGDFHYSNDAYDALAIALERVYEEPYEAIFRAKIARPAGLSNFAFWGESDVDDPHLRGQPLRPTPAELKGRNYGMIGSAGLLISASDLVRFRKALDDGKIIGPQMLGELNKPRGDLSIGEVLYGAFRVDTPMGKALSARGAEDWGDNAYLNAYPDCDAIIAIVTSRGPADDSGKPLFRVQIIEAVEEKLAPECAGGN
jgi:CubicO group peptidase (beta-lactamase class C family)